MYRGFGGVAFAVALQVRTGKLLEDLDAFAGQIAYIHADDYDPESEPLTIVTLSCDRIDILGRITATNDLQVVCVGPVWDLRCCTSVVVTFAYASRVLSTWHAAQLRGCCTFVGSSSMQIDIDAVSLPAVCGRFALNWNDTYTLRLWFC